MDNKIVAKSAEESAKDVAKFGLDITEYGTYNTLIVQDDKGRITTNEDDLMHSDYCNDAGLELIFDEVRSARQDFGYGSPQHISAKVGLDRKLNEMRKQKLGIAPNVYFTHVKASLEPIETIKVQERLRTLKKLIGYVDSVGQKGAKERFMKQLVGITKEAEIEAIGYNMFVKRDAVKNFKRYVYDQRKPLDRKEVVYLKKLIDFPRLIPAEIQDELKVVKEKNVFDDFEVLYLDYTGESEKSESSSTKQDKIEKDPILFGTFKEMPDRLYFIAAWIDETCDLTLNEVIDKMIEGEDYDFIKDAGEVTKDDIKRFQKEVDEAIRKSDHRSYTLKKQKTPFMERVKGLFIQ